MCWLCHSLGYFKKREDSTVEEPCGRMAPIAVHDGDELCYQEISSELSLFVALGTHLNPALEEELSLPKQVSDSFDTVDIADSASCLLLFGGDTVGPSTVLNIAKGTYRASKRK